MFFRNLHNLDLAVSEIGLGCNRLGENSQSESHWLSLVHRALDLGVNLFDTSESYQDGRSEMILGHALQDRSDVIIATKMSPDRALKEYRFSAERMIFAVEGSLRRLSRDVIDIYQLHSPSRWEMQNSDWAEGMELLKGQGKIRMRAVAVKCTDDAIWLIEQGLVDALQVTHNILFAGQNQSLFDLARSEGVDILVRKPLAQGILTGKFRPEMEINPGYRAAKAAKHGDVARYVACAEDLRPLAESYPGGMTRLAHHFSLSPAAVSASIPGARNITQLEENVAASNGSSLPEELIKEIGSLAEKWNLPPEE